MENYTNALPPGTRLTGPSGTYELLEVLGQGGFGITYKAELLLQGNLGAVRSGAFFAIKEFFLSEHNVRKGQTVTGTEGKTFQNNLRKFERESRLLAGISHPGICHVQDAFQANGTAYYVMDFYPGGTLSSLIARAQGGALDEPRAIAYLRHVASALSFLHKQGMAHLDLKPQNIMLKADGRPVLIDFGVSKQFDDDGKFRSSDTLGGSTPGYAPIEQANYSKGDGDPHLMDIYALGATFYKMLTGQTPPKASEVFNSGLPLEPLRHRGVSEQTISAIVKAMQPRKIDRFQSVDEMMSALSGSDSATEIDEPGEVKVIDVKPEQPRTKQSNQPPQPPQPNPDRPIDQKIPRTAIIIAAIVAIAVIGFFLIPKGGESNHEEIIENLAQADTISMPTTAPASQTDPSVVSDQSDRSDRSDQSDSSDQVAANSSQTYGHTTPKNFELCTTRDGKVFYFSQKEWNSVPASEKSQYSKKGVYVSGNGLKFIVALHDSGKEMTWDEAMSRYGNSMPDKSEAEVMAQNYQAICKAIPAFGGDKNLDHCYKTRTEWEHNSSWCWYFCLPTGYVNYCGKTYPYRVRTVSPVPKTNTGQKTTSNNTRQNRRRTTPNNSDQTRPDNSILSSPNNDSPLNSAAGSNIGVMYENPSGRPRRE